MDLQSWSASSAVIRGERDRLILFWISAPDDLLESLWDSPAGQATRELVAQISPTTFFTDSQVAQRNQLGQFLQKGFQQPGAVKAVIATFLLSPPGHFRIVNPESHLPSWLVPAYKNLYETVGVSSTERTSTVSPSVTPAPAVSTESEEISIFRHRTMVISLLR